MKMNDKQKSAYDVLATQMDLDFDYKSIQRDYFRIHGEIPRALTGDPNRHQLAFDAFWKDRYKCWRTMPKVRKRIIRASKKAAKHE